MFKYLCNKKKWRLVNIDRFFPDQKLLVNTRKSVRFVLCESNKIVLVHGRTNGLASQGFEPTFFSLYQIMIMGNVGDYSILVCKTSSTVRSYREKSWKEKGK